MMSKEEKDVVSTVYRRFIESESDEAWTDLDEKIYQLEWLSDKEIVVEAMVQYAAHTKKSTIFRCTMEHDMQYCFAPKIIESVESIILLNNETGELHAKNRYILAFYLAMSFVKLIYSVNVDGTALS